MNTPYGVNNLPTPPGSIYEDETIEETGEPIPFEELAEKPGDNVCWVFCVVQRQDFDGGPWGTIRPRSFPGIHFFSESESECRVLLSEDRIDWLQYYNFQFELDVRGLSEADIAFAVEAVKSGHGPGVDNLLSSLATDRRVRLEIAWAILARDVGALEPAAFAAFLCRYTLLSVHLTGNRAPSFGRLGVDQPSWAQYFTELARERIGQWPQDLNVDMQDVALFRGLIRSALDDKSPAHELDVSWTANENLKRLPGLLGLDLSTVQFKGFDAGSDCDTNVKSLRNSICRHVPTGFTTDTYEALPSALLNDLPYGAVNSTLTTMDATFNEFPTLSKPKNKLPVFLSHHTSLHGTAEPALCKWALSEEGSSFHRHMLARMAVGEAIEEKLLLLSSLIWYHKLLPCTMGPHTDDDNAATDFTRLLEGQQLRNEGEVLDRIAMTFIRVVDHPATCRFLHGAVRDLCRSLLEWLDPLTEEYCRQMQWAKPKEALKTAQIRYEEWTKRNPSYK